MSQPLRQLAGRARARSAHSVHTYGRSTGDNVGHEQGDVSAAQRTFYLVSGAEYPHPVTRQRVTAGRSFAAKAEALRWLAEAEVDLSRGQLLDPDGMKRSFGDYSNEADTPSSRERTAQPSVKRPMSA